MVSWDGSFDMHLFYGHVVSVLFSSLLSRLPGCLIACLWGYGAMGARSIYLSSYIAFIVDFMVTMSHH